MTTSPPTGVVLAGVLLLTPLPPSATRGDAPDQVGTQAQVCSSDAPPPGATLSPSQDLYCLVLTSRPELPDVTGTVELRVPHSPFGVAVDAAGHHLYDGILTVEGLPDPSTLGDYEHYVAWLTTPVFDPVVNLGPVENGTREIGRLDLNKFMIMVTAERELGGQDWAGSLVLRGTSPSARMSPPDLQEFLIGATGRPGGMAPGVAGSRTDSSAAGDGMAPGHGHQDGPTTDGWPRPPMSSGLTMLPALMALDAPDASPFLPSESLENLPLARPREVVQLEDGDRLALEAGLVRRRIRSRDYVMYGFNGQYPGPLIHVAEASTITVSFTNHVDWPTTIHWHGLRIDNASDGVPGVTQEPVEPGETFEYTVRFDDPGIYWYHPHHREDVLKDLGLYGNMLVDPEQPDYYGPVDREEVLMLDDFLMGEEGPLPFGQERASHALMGRFGNLMLVNGEPDYALDVAAGEVVRFYFTNVSNTRTFNLSLEGARLKVVGTDVGAFEREEWVGSVVLGPAERALINALVHPYEPLRIQVAHVLALLNSASSQQAIARIALDSGHTEVLRKECFSALADSARQFGPLLEDPTTASLITQAMTEPNLDLRTSASQALGAMNLPGTQVAQVILSHTRD